ncbi:MAG: SDR family oxidoreductase [Thermoplasmata archaeon]|jgi:3-oxoacyl-[acyl-carrier protein] reductase
MANEKIAVITGSSGGIGLATVKLFLKNKIKVYGLDINHTKLKNKKFRFIQCDVSQRECLENIEIQENIDIIVNTAGLLYYDHQKRFEEMMRVNFYGTVNTIERFIDHMKKNGGKIVNVASTGPLFSSTENITDYSITKSMIITYTRRLAYELGKYGINVNAVAPGFIETGMTKNNMDEISWKNKRDEISKKTVLKRIGYPEDVAGVILFLSSSYSDYITGQVIVVDGGRMDYFTHSL